MTFCIIHVHATALVIVSILKMEDAKREKRNRKDYWLHEVSALFGTLLP